MKKIIIPLLLGFGVTLALVIGQRLTTDAMAVVLGVAVGVTASIPTTVLLMALLRRAQRETTWNWNTARPEPPAHAYPLALPQAPAPQIIVLDPAQFAASAYQRGYPLPPPAMPNAPELGGLRPRRVIGLGEDD